MKKDDKIKVGDKVKWAKDGFEFQGIVDTVVHPGYCALVRQAGGRLELVPLEMIEKEESRWQIKNG